MEVVRTLEDPGMAVELGCDKQDLIDTLLFAREEANKAGLCAACEAREQDDE